MKAKIRKHKYGLGNECILERETVANEIGQLAVSFATHFGIVAAKTDGEDKAGRAKLELQTVDEIVQRSCNLAEQLHNEMVKRGWVLQLPDVPEEEDEEKK